MKTKKKYCHLWNEMEFKDRMKLMPYQLEYQKTTTLQLKKMAIKHHRAFMKEINNRIAYIDKEISNFDTTND